MFRRLLNLSSLVGLVILQLLVVFVNGCAGNSISENDQYIDTVKSLIKEGDIVFRRGEGIVSRIVIVGDANGEYSHIGMIIKKNDTLKVAHSVPGEHENDKDFDRVKIDDIDEFFSRGHASAGAVMRMELSEEQKNILSQIAVAKERQKVKFDHNYDLNDTCSLYCTEFVQLLYSKIGTDLNEGRLTTAYIPGMQGEYIMPSDIYANKRLKLIYKFN